MLSKTLTMTTKHSRNYTNNNYKGHKMQCIQFVRNVHNEHKRPRNSSTAIEHNIDVIVNAVL